MLETPWYRLIIVLTCLMKVTEIQAQCERPVVGENRIMVDELGQQTFLNGTTITFKCSPGYRIVDNSASRTITCVGTEWTNLELNCTKKSCGPLSDFLNGRYNYLDGILFGATAVAQCNEGYFLVGEKNRNCRDNGWDGRDPECEVVKCAPPPGILHGTFEPMDEVYDYNQAVTYSCTKDYTLFGESTIACSDNGTFPPPPRCSLVACETPNIENANRVEGQRPPYGYKNFVRYECIQGYTMKGSGSLVCEENGWNPPPPTCSLTQNPHPPTTSPPSEITQSPRPPTTSPPSEITQSPRPPTTSPPSESTCVKPSIMMIIAVVYMLLPF